MVNIILQHFDGKLRELDKLSMANIQEYAELVAERVEYSWTMSRGCHGVQNVLKQLWGLDKVWNIYEKYGEKHDVGQILYFLLFPKI